MYPVHAVLVNFGVKFGRNFIYNGHTLLVFLPVTYGEEYSTVSGIDERECYENTTNCKNRNLCLQKKSVGQTIVSKTCREETKVVHWGIPSTFG